jgi:ribosomal-protein-alanine N-acetyltransferase
MIVCRNMRQSDTVAVYTLVNTNLDGTFSIDVIEYFLLCWPEGQIVAEDIFGNIVGAICGTKSEDGIASISLFAVDAKYRSQGIGHRLYDSFRTRCYMEGHPEIRLELRKTNIRAFNFYQRLGFKIIEEIPSLYGPGEDGLRMSVQLNQINHVSS